jgi:hypothetical protein
MPQKKKQGPSRKLQIAIIFISVILVFSYVIVIFSPYLNSQLPSPLTFAAEEWMSFVPPQTAWFRYLNISTLQGFPLLFSTPVVLSIQDPAMNISFSDVTYGVDLQTSDGTGVNVIAMNSSSLAKYSSILASGNLTSSVYDNVTLYKLAQDPLNMSVGAWICVSPKAVILSGGDTSALSAIKSVLDASSNTFFENDSFKVAYQLTTGGKDYLIFTYYESGNNSYNVDWEMRSASNGSTIAVRNTFHFPTTDALNSNYNNLKTLLPTAKDTYTVEKFAVFDFSYPQGEIRYVILGG